MSIQICFIYLKLTLLFQPMCEHARVDEARALCRLCFVFVSLVNFYVTVMLYF